MDIPLCVDSWMSGSVFTSCWSVVVINHPLLCDGTM